LTKKLMLDAGHGLTTSGKQTPDNPPVKEYSLNQKVVDYIVANLKDYDIEIKFAHDVTGKTDTSLEERINRTNTYKPDLFVSIHHNAYNGQWGPQTGTEVYYHPYGTADDKKMATLVAPLLAANTGLYNRGVKTAAYAVLTCNHTAILVEGGFMDSTIDNPIIKSEKGQKAYAKAVSEAVINFLGLKKVAAPVVTEPVASEPEKVNANTHIVVKGDTLWSISIKYEISIEDLRTINNLKNDTLSIGQELYLNQQATASYTVVKGDTLYSIAQKFNVTVDEIVKNNKLTTTVLSIGQKLIVQKTHTVVKGDTLYALATKYNTTVAAIKTTNKLTSDTLSIGQILILP